MQYQFQHANSNSVNEALGMFKGGGGQDVTSLFPKKQLAAVYLKVRVFTLNEPT